VSGRSIDSLSYQYQRISLAHTKLEPFCVLTEPIEYDFTHMNRTPDGRNLPITASTKYRAESAFRDILQYCLKPDDRNSRFAR
jgi:hypothetical protein